MEAARLVEHHRGASATSRRALTRGPRATPPSQPDADRIADRIAARLEASRAGEAEAVAATLRRIETDVGDLRKTVGEHGGKLKSLSDELIMMQATAGSAAGIAERAVKEAKVQAASVASDVGASAAGAVAEVLNGKVIFDPKQAFSWRSFKWVVGAVTTWIGFTKLVMPAVTWGLNLAKRGIEQIIGHPMGPDL